MNKVDGKFYFNRMLHISYDELNKSIVARDGVNLLLKLLTFLTVTFAIREKIFGRNETVNEFRGLKRFYNILKHKYSFTDIIIDMIPQTEQQEVIFMPINQIVKKYNVSEENAYYTNYVCGKSIAKIAEMIYTNTITELE